MTKRSDAHIIESWKKNVHPWIVAIRDGTIESRVRVTNTAIVETVVAQSPRTVLDVGCGEGWLVRALGQCGIDVLGIDGVPQLIEHATQQGDGRFRTLPYEALSSDVLQEKFDVMVCNFSLLGHESVHRIFQQAQFLLQKHGSLIIQTMHPVAGCGEENYEDGWKDGSWAGFSDAFCDPAPWYFRTLETWKALFAENHLRLNDIVEPVDPTTQRPVSIIFTGMLTTL
ncbi:class I SAM-dependent methyltransferase [Nitrospira sp. M1]